MCGTIEIKSLVAVTQAVYFVELLNNHLPLLRQFVLGLSHPVVASFAIVKINNKLTIMVANKKPKGRTAT